MEWTQTGIQPSMVPDSGSAPEPGMFVNICQFFFIYFFTIFSNL